MLPIYIHT